MLENSGWVDEETRERHVKAIKRGRKAELELPTTSTPGSNYLSNLHFKEHELLSREIETELAQQVEVGRAAQRQLTESGWVSEDEREELAEKISDGRTAEGRLILSNLRLVAYNARKIRSRFPNFDTLSVTFEDLLQEGDIGLISAVERFEWRKGYRFSTYATYWIRQQMRLAILNTGSMIRLPIARRDQIMRLKRAEREYLQKNEDRKPTIKELGEAAGMNEKVAKKVQDIGMKDFTAYSYDKLLVDSKGEESTNTLLIRLSDNKEITYEQMDNEESMALAYEDLRRGMEERLTPEEIQMVEMRYGIWDGPDTVTGAMSMDEIAAAIGCSKKDVHNTVQNSMQKLKRSARNMGKMEIANEIFTR
jgi:RNA polymerase primary sigma factor